MDDTWQNFFAQTSPPSDLEATTAQLKTWVQRHAKLRRKMALVTSGGTTVPLERNTVRHVSNINDDLQNF